MLNYYVAIYDYDIMIVNQNATKKIKISIYQIVKLSHYRKCK